MAAPGSAYLNNGEKINLEVKDNVGTVISSFDAYVAAYIYGSSNIKSLFYLDAVAEIEIKDAATDAVVRKGFIGLIINNPANKNYKMHNISRHYKGRLDELITGSWLFEYIALSDGGLNTLGDLGAFQMLNEAVGEIKPQIVFISSFHNDTTEYGFFYRVNSGSWIKSISGGNINRNSSLTGNVIISVDNINAGDLVEIQAYITNEEGTYNPGLQHWFDAKPRKMTLKYHATIASSAYNGTATRDLYVGNAVLRQGSLVFGNVELGNQAAAGYYINDNQWYEVRFDPVLDKTKVVAQGVCTPAGWPVGDPLRDDGSYTTETAFYSANQSNVCFSDQAVTIYMRNYNGLYYTSPAFTTLAANGYYRYNTGRWYLISGGAKFTSGTGNTGLCGA